MHKNIYHIEKKVLKLLTCSDLKYSERAAGAWRALVNGITHWTGRQRAALNSPRRLRSVGRIRSVSNDEKGAALRDAHASNGATNTGKPNNQGPEKAPRLHRPWMIMSPCTASSAVTC